MTGEPWRQTLRSASCARMSWAGKIADVHPRATGRSPLLQPGRRPRSIRFTVVLAGALLVALLPPPAWAVAHDSGEHRHDQQGLRRGWDRGGLRVARHRAERHYGQPAKRLHGRHRGRRYCSPWEPQHPDPREYDLEQLDWRIGRRDRALRRRNSHNHREYYYGEYGVGGRGNLEGQPRGWRDCAELDCRQPRWGDLLGGWREPAAREHHDRGQPPGIRPVSGGARPSPPRRAGHKHH